MININDILETINMIKEENLDIRTVTMGISLYDCAGDDIDVVCDRIYDLVPGGFLNGRRGVGFVETDLFFCQIGGGQLGDGGRRRTFGDFKEDPAQGACVEQDPLLKIFAGEKFALFFGELTVEGDLDDRIGLLCLQAGQLEFEDHIPLFPEVAHSGKDLFALGKGGGLQDIAAFEIRDQPGGNVGDRSRERCDRKHFHSVKFFAGHHQIFRQGDQT